MEFFLYAENIFIKEFSSHAKEDNKTASKIFEIAFK